MMMMKEKKGTGVYLLVQSRVVMGKSCGFYEGSMIRSRHF
jgi:hypothetical protein